MNKKIAVFILMVAAAVLFTIPLISITRSVRLKNHGVQTESTVTGRTRNKGLSTVTVSFNTPDGNQVIAKAAKRYIVSTGEKIMIWYDPASPAKIDFGDTMGYNMRGVIAGGLLFILGLYYFIRYSFRDKANKRLIN